MQVVRIFLFLILFCLAKGCSQNFNSESIQINRFKKHDGESTTIHLTSFHLEDSTSIPGAYWINDQLFTLQSYDPLVLDLNPGKYEIRAGAVGKEWLNTKIQLRKGDSTVVRFFLKQDSLMFDAY